MSSSEEMEYFHKKYEHIFKKSSEIKKSKIDGKSDESDNDSINSEKIQEMQVEYEKISKRLREMKKNYNSDTDESESDAPPTPKRRMMTQNRTKMIRNRTKVEPEQTGEILLDLASETFSTYRPEKLNIENAKIHPDAVVETASMSIISPADITYQLSIPYDPIIATGKLSELQLEAVVYASQMHEKLLPDGSRAGFFLGMIFFANIYFLCYIF